MIITQGGYTIEWNGGHYAEVSHIDYFFDMPESFSFSWEKDNPTQFDFVESAISFLSYIEY